MTPIALFGSSFLIGLSGAVMPGPLLTLTISESLKQGWRAPVWLVTGHALLELTVVVLLASGLGAAAVSPTVLRIMAIAGGGVLAYMGAGALRTARHPPEYLLTGQMDSQGTGAAARSARALMLTGAAVSLSNPYWVVWWATIGVTYVLASRDGGAADLPAFYLGHISSDYVWFVAVGLAFSAGRRWLRPGRVRALFAICGIVLGGFGALFVLAGLGIVGDLRTVLGTVNP